MASLYILDTNILVHLVRGDAVGERIRAIFSPTMIDPRPLLCTVTEGELRSLAFQFRWGAGKIASGLFYLSYFKPVSIEHPDVYEAYAAIDAFSISRGYTLGKNDLWIAAAAHVTGACLLTTDNDFDHLHPAFLERELVNKAGDY